LSMKGYWWCLLCI